jgi:DNA-binding beta-propeller fold protein YncE
MSIIENDTVERVLRDAKVRGRSLRRRRRLLSMSLVSALALATSAVVVIVTTSRPSNSNGVAPAGWSAPTAYVFGPNGTDITPIDTATNTAGAMIVLPESSGAVGHFSGMVVTPNGKTAYVANATSSADSGSVTPIDVATNTAGTAIEVGGYADALVISPNGKTVYVAVTAANRVQIVPISTRTNSLGKPINVPGTAVAAALWPNHALAITPNGRTLYVGVVLHPHVGATDMGAVIPIDAATSTVGPTIAMDDFGTPSDVVIPPSGKGAYVLCVGYYRNQPNDSVVVIGGRSLSGASPRLVAASSLGTSLWGIAFTSKTFYMPTSTGVVWEDLSYKAAGTIRLGRATYMAISPNGKSAYVALSPPGAEGRVVPLNLATRSGGKAILVGTGAPGEIAFSPGGTTAGVANGSLDTVTPIDTRTNSAGRPITVGPGPFVIVIAP